jgi:hypothetical protein
VSLAIGDMVVLLRSDPDSDCYLRGLRVGAIGTVVGLEPCWICAFHQQVSCQVHFPSPDVTGCCPHVILRKIDGELRRITDWDWRDLVKKRTEAA